MSERLEYKGMARCQVCGEPVSPMWANHDDGFDPAVVVIRCFQCAAVEEAEWLTQQAADGHRKMGRSEGAET